MKKGTCNKCGGGLEERRPAGWASEPRLVCPRCEEERVKAMLVVADYRPDLPISWLTLNIAEKNSPEH